EITVDQGGYVTSGRPLRGDPGLLEAAAAAAMGWRYAPSTRNGTPIKLVATLTFNFDPCARAQAQTPHEPESPEVSKHLTQVEANPQNEAAVLALGKAYYVSARYDDALKQFQTAVSLAPDDPAAYYQVGSALMSLKYYNDAIDAINHAVVLKPDYLEALALLA